MEEGTWMTDGCGQETREVKGKKTGKKGRKEEQVKNGGVGAERAGNK